MCIRDSYRNVKLDTDLNKGSELIISDEEDISADDSYLAEEVEVTD